MFICLWVHMYIICMKFSFSRIHILRFICRSVFFFFLIFSFALTNHKHRSNTPDPLKFISDSTDVRLRENANVFKEFRKDTMHSHRCV